MILFALGSLLLGILCGYFLFPPEAVPVMDRLMSYALMLLLLSVGIEVGTNKTVFRKIREYNVRILVIPFGVAVGSIAGGLLLGFFLGMPVNESAAVSSGFGFYSVSAVILRGLGGAQLGTVAFMTNVLRELMAFLMIPFVARHFGRYAAVAPSGATAMDTTLPVIARATDDETALIAVISGVVLTALVPVLVPLLYNLLYSNTAARRAAVFSHKTGEGKRFSGRGAGSSKKPAQSGRFFVGLEHTVFLDRIDRMW